MTIVAGFHLTGSEDEERCATLGFGDSGGPLVGHWLYWPLAGVP